MPEKKQGFKTFMLGKAIDRNAEEVRVKNYNNFKAFVVLIIIMTGINMFLWRRTLSAFIFIPLGIFVAMGLSMYFMKRHNRYVTLVFYLWMTPIMIMLVVMGTLFDPDNFFTTAMVVLCVSPVLILDKPWRIVTYILVTATVGVICCCIAANGTARGELLPNLVLFAALDVGISCIVLQDRISNVEYMSNMKHIAETDRLTEIRNRGAGEELVKLLMKNGRCGMFALLDLDDFKYVNDFYGHGVGDEALRLVAGCLSRAFRDNDVVMRFGGDEFAVFAQGIDDAGIGEICMKRLLLRIGALSIPEAPRYRFSVSIGISFFDPRDGKGFETIYKESDEALYYVKSRGKNAYAFYDEI